MFNLNRHLVALLSGHGVNATTTDDGTVLVESTGLTAVLEGKRVNPHSILLSIRAATTDGTVLGDVWAGMGEEDEEAVNDGLSAFCQGGFHVFLAAAWGVLETDQVDHLELQTAGHLWDVYVGGLVGRASAGAALPVPSFWDAYLAAVESSLAGSTESMIGRLYAHHFDSEMTFEALINEEPNPMMESFWSGLPWVPSSTGFASRRMLWMAVPRSGAGPAHLRSGVCGESGGP